MIGKIALLLVFYSTFLPTICGDLVPMTILHDYEANEVLCDYGWSSFDHFCYKVGRNADFESAQNYCLQNKANLASIHSSRENKFVLDLARSDGVVKMNDMIWIGMRRHNMSTEFFNVDKSPVDFTNWAADRPDNVPNEHCVHAVSDGDTYGMEEDWENKWNDLDCSHVMRAFVCKMPALKQLDDLV